MRGFFLSVLLLIFINVSAQQATTSGGGSGQANNIILDWSIGELTLVNTAQNGLFVLTQGLLQGQLIELNKSNVLGNGEFSIFPNPVRRTLRVGIGFFETGRLSMQLFSDNGSLLRKWEETITAFGNRSIDMTPYAGGVYFLHAVFTPTNGSARKNTYKILHLQ